MGSLSRTNDAGGGAISIRSTDDGLHLEGSILWLDAQRNGDLSFLSSANQSTGTFHPQVIATEETVKLLEASKKRPKALVCQYNRPFSIGKLKMELLPSGGVLGGASLHVEIENRRILYAPSLQTQKNDLVRTMQLKKAHTLILNAYHPNPSALMPNRKKEKERLLETVRRDVAKGVYPIIRCQPIATAQEITKLLADNDIPVAVHPTIYRANKVYENYGSRLGSYSLHSPRSRRKVLLHPLKDVAPHQRRPLPEAPVLYVEDTFDETDPDVFQDVEDRFYMSSTCDGKELREIIAAVTPKEVYIFGPYAKRYAEDLRGLGVRVKPLYPNDQPTLF